MTTCASVYTLLLVLLTGSWQAQAFLIKDGNCSIVSANIPFVQNLEVEKYLGTWYELERYEQDYERNLECVTTEYRSSQPIGMLEVKIRGLPPQRPNETTTGNSYQTVSGIGTFGEQSPENGTIAKLSISLGKGSNATNYWIVDTDYVNYAVVYSCTSFLEADQSVEGYWLLSRTRSHLTDADATARVNSLRSTYFEMAHMRATNQTEELCPMEQGLPPAPSSVILPPL